MTELSAVFGVVVVVEQPVMEPIASAAAEATARSLVFMEILSSVGGDAVRPRWAVPRDGVPHSTPHIDRD